jgi:hypothetical protein
MTGLGSGAGVGASIAPSEGNWGFTAGGIVSGIGDIASGIGGFAAAGGCVGALAHPPSISSNAEIKDNPYRVFN